MRIEIRQITSADVSNLETFSPAVQEEWLVQADVTVACVGDPPGGDTFQFEACSEAWVTKRLEEGPFFSGRLLVFRRYSYESLQAAIGQCVEKAARSSVTWDGFARQLNSSMAWEFENYQP